MRERQTKIELQGLYAKVEQLFEEGLTLQDVQKRIASQAGIRIPISTLGDYRKKRWKPHAAARRQAQEEALALISVLEKLPERKRRKLLTTLEWKQRLQKTNLIELIEICRNIPEIRGRKQTAPVRAPCRSEAGAAAVQRSKSEHVGGPEEVRC